MAYGTKTVVGGQIINGIPQPAFNSYTDGAAAPASDIVAAWQTFGATALNDDQLHALVRFRMGYGMSWGQAKAALQAMFGNGQLLPSGAVLDTYQARVNAIMLMKPPLWSDTQPGAVGGGSMLDFQIPTDSGLLAGEMGR